MKIDFQPFKIQWSALQYLMDNESTQIFFGGSVRVSKTYLLAAWATIYALQYPNISGAICRSRLTTLKKTTLQTLFEFFRNVGLKEGPISGSGKDSLNYQFNRQDMILEFNNGSKLFFLELYNNPSDPNFDRLLSLSLTFAAVDEVSQISKKAIDIIQTRLSHMLKEYGLIPKLLLVSNPNKGWLYEEYYKKYKEGTLPSWRKVVLGLPQDNPSLDESYVENLKKVLNAPEKERLLKGNWEYADEDFSLFKYDDILQSFYNDVKEGTPYLTADIANVGNDKTVIGIWSGMRLINVSVSEKKTTEYIVKDIKEKMKTFKIPIKNVVIDADGIGIGVADYLKGCVKFKNNSSPFNSENYRNLRSQCYFKLSEMINEIRLDDKYKDEIIADLQAHKIDDNEDQKTSVISKENIKSMIGRSPDFSDMIMMRMYYEFKTKLNFTFL